MPFYGLWYVDSSFAFTEALCWAIVFMMPAFVLKKGVHFYAGLYFLLFYGPAFLIVGHQLIFNSPLNPASVFAVLGTNFKEILSFLKAFMNLTLAGFLLGAACFWPVFGNGLNRLKNPDGLSVSDFYV